MSFRKSFSVNLFWVGLGKYSNMLVQLIVTAVLARILTPNDYGLIAIATVFMTFFTMLSDVGIGPAIIHNQNLDEKDYENLHSFTVYLGVFLYVVFVAISPLISHFYNDDRLNLICLIMGVPIVFYCAQIVPLNLLYKKKNFKYIARTSIITNTIAGVTAILYAYFIGGPISLIVLQIVNSILLLVIYKYKERVRLKLIFSISSIKKIFTYSFYQFSYNIVNYFSRNLDNLLIGKYVGLNALGYYEKSYKLMLMPIRSITNVLTPVVLPMFAEFQDNRQYVYSKYKRLLEFVSILSFPISILFFFAGKEIIILLFGSQWEGSVLTFKILSLSLGFQVLSSTTGSIFQAIGDTKKMFVSQIINTTQMVLLLCLAIFLFKSIESVAIAFCVEEFISFIVVFYYLFRLFDVSLASLFRIIFPSVMASLLLFAVLFLSSYFFDVNIGHLFISFLVKGILTTCIIIGSMQILHYFDFRGLVKKIKSGLTHNI